MKSRQYENANDIKQTLKSKFAKLSAMKNELTPIAELEDSKSAAHCTIEQPKENSDGGNESLSEPVVDFW